MKLGIIIPALILFGTSHANIQSSINNLINKVDPNINLGMEVLDLTTGKVLYKRNASSHFIPASNMKLFSDAAALMVLGPDYNFVNKLKTDAHTLKTNELKGSLYLELTGDPSFTETRLFTLLSKLKDWNVKNIHGNIYIESTHSNISPYAKGWGEDDLAYSYGAPLAPLMINANRVLATVNPGSAIGKLAIIEIEGFGKGITLNNLVYTVEDDKKCGVSFAMNAQNELTVRGCISLGQLAIKQALAIRNPFIYAKKLIKTQLKNLDIELDGEILLGKVPSNALLIAIDKSKSIAQIMADTLKPSDNLYADSLFLHAAEKIKGSTVNWEDAKSLIQDFLQKQTGINLSNAVFVDGSGLSRNNALSAEETVELLKFLYQRFPVTYEYIAALPVSGRDGTLQKRFNKLHQQDLIRAKTGTMKGVISLSGYLYTKNFHTLAFTIFINKKPGTKPQVSGKYRSLVDNICNILLQAEPSQHLFNFVFTYPRLQFQQHPTSAQAQRREQAHWRRLESLIKHTIRHEEVTILLHHNELMLKDFQANPTIIWQKLQKVRHQYPFALILESAINPLVKKDESKQNFLWIHNPNMVRNERIWTVR